MSTTNSYEDIYGKVKRVFSLLNVKTTIQNTSYQIMWLPDTGVEHDVINISHIKKLDVGLASTLEENQENGVDDATGAAAPHTNGLLGTMNATLEFNGRCYETTFKVTENAIAPILSKKGCIALGLINPEWPHKCDATDVGGGDTTTNNDESNIKQMKVFSNPSQENVTATSLVVSSHNILPTNQNVLQVETTIVGETFQINWLPETGADLELMSVSDFKKLGDSITSALKIKTSEVIGEDGKGLQVVGTIGATLTLNDCFYPTIIYICEGIQVPILSKAGCISLGLLNSNWPYLRSRAISENPLQKHNIIRKTLLAGKKFECSFIERGCHKTGMTRREWEEHEGECQFNPCPSAVRKCSCPLCHPSVLTNDAPPSPLLSRHLIQVHKHSSTDLFFNGRETESIELGKENFSRTFSQTGLHFGGNFRIVNKTSGALLGEYITVAQCFHPEDNDIDQEVSYALTCCRLSPLISGPEEYYAKYLMKSVDSKEHITWKVKPIDFAELKTLIVENQQGGQRFHYSIPEYAIRTKFLRSDDFFVLEVKFVQ